MLHPTLPQMLHSMLHRAVQHFVDHVSHHMVARDGWPAVCGTNMCRSRWRHVLPQIAAPYLGHVQVPDLFGVTFLRPQVQLQVEAKGARCKAEIAKSKCKVPTHSGESRRVCDAT